MIGAGQRVRRRRAAAGRLVVWCGAVWLAVNAKAEPVVWAKGAVHFGHECTPPATRCTLADVKSPDGKNALRVSRSGEDFTFEVIRGTTHVVVHPGADPDAGLEEPFVDMEVLWAPDSRAVSLAWNETAITDRTEVYVLDRDRVRQMSLKALKEGFAREFPPCAGDVGPCRLGQDGRFYNYLTVAWIAPHTLVLMAEVPPSSSWGRNMGKVTGYEVDAFTGVITRALLPAAFKRRWQSHMGWDFDVEDAR